MGLAPGIDLTAGGAGEGREAGGGHTAQVTFAVITGLSCR